MARISDEFCRKRFYRNFAKMKRPQQQGVLEAFATIMEMTNEEPEQEEDAPLLEALEEGVDAEGLHK